MRNENNSRRTGRASIFENVAPRQALSAPRPAKRIKNLWKAPVTAEYLQAVREADELVFGAILRGMTLRHSAHALKA